MMDQGTALNCSDAEEYESADIVDAPPGAGDIADMLLSILSDNLDHPEVWPQVKGFAEFLPDLPKVLNARLASESALDTRLHLCILGILCHAEQDPDWAIQQIEPLGIMASQSALVQGAIFYLHGLNDPGNPKYQLEGKICAAPFVQLDVLETTTHLCCASWLQTSAGNLSVSEWQDVWNSDAAQDIRASIHDGSYRFCNKTACPKIQGADLADAAELAATSDLWRDVIEQAITAMPVGPEVVNLAYDRTCNLSCPSCRTEKFAADEATRARYEDMQQYRILPLLRDAKTVFVTGSGDPFASKNFRRLMTQLTEKDYPRLGFQIMTNGMLFTPRQWESFPTLHGRTRILKISIDAAEGPTHELLRRGAKWPVMLENMVFAGELTAQGLVDHFELVFTVQHENYREMGDAVDLAHKVGATGVYFARLTNWGTFSTEEYARKAVFLPSHPDYADFIEHMQDERLQDPMVLLGDMSAFVRERIDGHRVFAG
jgi:hypothetical protein